MGVFVNLLLLGVHMTFAITTAGNHAIKLTRIQKISKSNQVSEEQKAAFLKRKTFKCKVLNIRLTVLACLKYQSVAITAKPFEPTYKCLTCKKFNKKKIVNLEQKECLLEVEFPGYCSGKKIFERSVRMSIGAWNNKICCSKKCTVTLSNFKIAGYKNINDVSEQRRQTSMVVDLRV